MIEYTYEFPSDSQYTRFMYEGEKEAVTATAEREYAPPTWEERDVVHAFDDGWTIEMLRSPADRSSEVGFLGGCTAGSQWIEYLSKDLVLFSLRAPDGTPHATLNMCRYPMPTQPDNRTPYTGCRFKSEARLVDGVGEMWFGQFHSGWYGRGWEQESVQECKERLESWWDSLKEVEAE